MENKTFRREIKNEETTTCLQDLTKGNPIPTAHHPLYKQSSKFSGFGYPITVSSGLQFSQESGPATIDNLRNAIALAGDYNGRTPGGDTVENEPSRTTIKGEVSRQLEAGKVIIVASESVQ